MEYIDIREPDVVSRNPCDARNRFWFFYATVVFLTFGLALWAFYWILTRK